MLKSSIHEIIKEVLPDLSRNRNTDQLLPKRIINGNGNERGAINSRGENVILLLIGH